MSRDGQVIQAIFVLGTLGIGALHKGLKDSKLFRVVKDTPTSKIPTAAMGSYVEIKGMLEAPRDEKYIAPLSSTECAYFIWKIERLHKSKKRSRWVHEHTTYSASHIFIRGESGKLAAISLQDMEGEFGTYKTKTVTFSNPENLPTQISQYYQKKQFRKLFTKFLGINYGRYRIIEEAVPAGIPLYALGYASKPKTLRPAKFNRKVSFYDKLIPINELKNIKSPSQRFEFFKKRHHEMNQQIKLVLKPMNKERWRLFQLNKVYLSSKGEESFVSRGNTIAKLAVFGGGALLSAALWLSTYFF